MKKLIVCAVALIVASVSLAGDIYPVTPKDIGIKLTGFELIEAVPDLDTHTWTVQVSAKWQGMPIGSSNNVDVVAPNLSMDCIMVCTKDQIEAYTGEVYDDLTIAQLRTAVLEMSMARIATRFQVEFIVE